jgi:hypothetical protein
MARSSQPINPEPIRWSLVAPLIAVFVALVPIPAWVVDEFYSRDMYPWLQRWSTTFTNVLPFAMLDVILIVTIVAVGYRAMRLFNVARQRGVIDALWEAVRRIVRAVSIATLLFLWAWGFNYRRLPLESALKGGVAEQPTVEALNIAFGDAAALASRLRPQVQTEGRLHSIGLALKDPMNVALQSLSREPLHVPGQPKYSLVLTPFFTWSGVTGMMNPFGHESIVLSDLLPFERPFVLAHEWAHLAGQADEAEASAVGWLACMKGDPTLAYSANLFLIGETLAALPESSRASLTARLDPDVRGDLEAIEIRRRQERPVVQKTASAVYDEYLRANRVADGTASYGRALRLILSSPFREALAGYTISVR